MHQAPRCGAKTRSGSPCRSPAVHDKRRCRMHGGALGSGAPSGPSNGRYKHGHYTAEAISRRREIRGLLQATRAMLKGSGPHEGESTAEQRLPVPAISVCEWHS
ncbi:HGGxSTG domain-containing protein [Chthonobacter albigriseus]|uniref:HGGxSTG domain-containing protein n=1 Tax=Chthonobacter albigriseus TaxID=1683161 RepID=UPI0024584EDF|nr:HGGxSTG domain-containing protein [Chthonobacter albigriseus]